MRRSSLVFLLVGLVAACGDDGGASPQSKNTGTSKGEGDGDNDIVQADAGKEISIPNNGDNTGNAGGSGADTGECPRAQLAGFDHYTGDKPWSQADLEACRAACATSTDPNCVATSCPAGADVFNTCVNVEVNACLSAAGGPCRTQFEDEICCAGGNCDPKAADVATCVKTACAAEIAAFKTCGSDEATFKLCAGASLPLCVSDGSAPPPAAVADAGTPAQPPATDPTTTTSNFGLSVQHELLNMPRILSITR